MLLYHLKIIGEYSAIEYNIIYLTHRLLLDCFHFGNDIFKRTAWHKSYQCPLRLMYITQVPKLNGYSKVPLRSAWTGLLFKIRGTCMQKSWLLTSDYFRSLGSISPLHLYLQTEITQLKSLTFIFYQFSLELDRMDFKLFPPPRPWVFSEVRACIRWGNQPLKYHIWIQFYQTLQDTEKNRDVPQAGQKKLGIWEVRETE